VARLGAAAERLAGALAVSIVPDHRKALTVALARARADLGDGAFAAAWSEGEAMPSDQAVAYALAQSHVEQLHGDRLLSPRELHVARLVALGLTNRQLAAELVISPRTADHHVANILAKLGLSGRAQIGVWAERTGIANG
jgi:non-specific serine/threonine protein kinase